MALPRISIDNEKRLYIVSLFQKESNILVQNMNIKQETQVISKLMFRKFIKLKDAHVMSVSIRQHREEALMFMNSNFTKVKSIPFRNVTIKHV